MKRKKTIETGFRLLFLTCGLIAVAFVLLISIYLIIAGIPAIREVGLINFLSGELVESGDTEGVFSIPKDKRTEAYITGRFG